MSKYETILVSKENGVTTVRFNRPHKRNAMNPTLHREMYSVLDELEFDDETQVLVLTGQGEAFSAGQDLKEYFDANKDSPRDREEIRRISHGWRHQKLYNFAKPTIAMINGWCFGGAFTVVASTDVAIAADDAIFGLSEINFGSLPAGLVAKVVSGLMMPRQALYYSMTGEKFDGRRATELGFTTLSVPRAELEQRTLAIADVLKRKDPRALRATKELFKGVDLRSMSFDDAWNWLNARERQLTLEQRNNNWMEKGVAQFMEGSYRPGLEPMPKSD
jgi:trans-feruloyl-CoA hydratase/vanillin synthase